MAYQPANGPVPIEAVQARAYTVPTDAPEADGTHSWDATTIVIAQVAAGGHEGIGYTYNHVATAKLVNTTLADAIRGMDAMQVPLAWQRMVCATGNIGLSGIGAAVIAAVDTALWDLKARLLGLPLALLFGMVRNEVCACGSGGFTSYTPAQLKEQLAAWAAQGIGRVKIKVGAEPAADPERVQQAREAIGPDVELFVDAAGAYQRKQALALAERFAQLGVSWFEEPVSSDDLEGLRLLRDRCPPSMQITAGGCGCRLAEFQQLLRTGAVDVLQADASRCAGFTEFLRVGILAQGWQLPLAAHTAPSLHLHPCCALPAVCHIEYFHDHVRIEHMFFDGAADTHHGMLRPDLSQPGLGLTLRGDVARHFRD